MDGGTPIAPWQRLLELRRNPNQQVFAPDCCHELNPDWETLRSPMKGQRDRRLSRYVEWRCEKTLSHYFFEQLQQIAFLRRHLFERGWRLPNGGRQQQVESH
jgi:hypothetical protein